LNGGIFLRFEVNEDVTVHEYKGANENHMRTRIRSLAGLATALFIITACGPQITVPEATEESDPDLHFVRGYRSDSDPCKLTGETAFTNQFLDDAADLVTCLTGYEGAAEFVRTTGARIVTQTQSYTLYSVPRR